MNAAKFVLISDMKKYIYIYMFFWQQLMSFTL